MGCRWSAAPLRELLSYIGKGIAPIYTEADSATSIAVLGQKCIRNYSVDYKQARLHDEARRAIKPEKFVQPGDILVNATGIGSAGRVAQVIEEPNRRYITDGHVITLRAKGIDPYYLGYFVKSKQSSIETMAEGSTGQTEMNKDRLQDEVVVKYPLEPEIQRAIARFGISIDKTIALNARTNGYLAALIAARFAEDFGDDCHTTRLGDVLRISTKTAKPQDHAGEIWEHYSIPAFDESHRPVMEPANEIKSNKYIVSRNSILISKLNPSIKRFWLPACLTDHPVCSTEFIVFEPIRPENKSFYAAAISSNNFQNYLMAHVTGSTGSRQRAQPKSTLDFPMLNPSESAIHKFCSFADPIYAQMECCARESANLERLRDTLLPKLMSGEIDVSKVEVPMPPNSHLCEH
jgi:type I restriction enzyme S subunit